MAEIVTRQIFGILNVIIMHEIKRDGRSPSTKKNNSEGNQNF